MTYAAIERDRAQLTPFAVPSFADVHGDKWNDICDTIHVLHETAGWDELRQAATDFVGKHMDTIQRQL